MPQQRHRARKLVSLLRGCCEESKTAGGGGKEFSLALSPDFIEQSSPLCLQIPDALGAAASKGLGCSGHAKSFTLDTIDHKQQCCVIGTSHNSKNKETIHQKGFMFGNLCWLEFIFILKVTDCESLNIVLMR